MINDIVQGQEIEEGATPESTETPQTGGEQEKRLFEMLKINASNFVNDEKNAQRIVENLKQGSPVKTIASEAAGIMESLTASAAKKGAEPSPDIVLAATSILIEDIIDLGTAAGVIKKGEDESQLAEKSLQEFLKIATGGGSEQKQEQPAPEEQAPPMEQSPMARGVIGAIGGQSGV